MPGDNNASNSNNSNVESNVTLPSNVDRGGSVLPSRNNQPGASRTTGGENSFFLHQGVNAQNNSQSAQDNTQPEASEKSSNSFSRR